MLEPRLPELLLELRKRGYATARVKPKSLGGYNITFIEPEVAAIKESTYILYDPDRRSLTVEGSDTDRVIQVFNETEEILGLMGSDPAKGVLFYELHVKAKAGGGRRVLDKVIRLSGLNLELSAVPVSLVSVNGDPNSAQWFQLDIRPLWSSWTDRKVHYEVVLIYRDDKEKLINVLRNINEVIKEILREASNSIKENV